MDETPRAALAIPPDRPQLECAPCPVCATQVEPLRARAVLAFDDGFRFLCSPECRERYLAGERHPAARDSRRASSSVSAAGTSDPMLRSIRKPKRKASASSSSSSAEFTGPHAAASAPVPFPTIAVGIAALGIVLGALGNSWTMVGLSVSLTLLVSALTIAGSVRHVDRAGLLGSAIAPIGAALAAAAAALSFSEGHGVRMLLVGAAFASGTAVVRAWLDASAARPLADALSRLAARLPEKTKVPVRESNAPGEMPSREADVARVRAGEEILVSEGDVVAVDGTVVAGDAHVLLHPAARAPVRRRAGDAVLGGARVVDGAIRVLAVNVGPDRALVRPARFGDGRAADAARVTRLVARSIQFAVLVVGLAALLGVVVSGHGGLATRLGAVAAVLLGAPLLALRRAAEGPFVAAAAKAAERGIVFQHGRAVDRAGRVDVAALSAHGTVTEGDPEVVEVHAYAPDVERAVALAAAAEAATPGHAVGIAFARYARIADLAELTVRRAASVPGRGVTALGPDDEPIVVGSRQLLLDQGISVAIADEDAERAEHRGHTVVFVGVEGKLRAIVALRDEERPGARAAVQRLIDLGVEVVLVSGNHRATVEALARTLDVDHVKAELGPEERGNEVRRLREAGGVVAAIGRTGPDDAMLAAADVPVVLGAAGSAEGDRAISLTGDDVRDAAAALWIAQAARRESLRAVTAAAVGGLTLVVLATAGLLTPGAVALAALGVDGFALPAAARMMRRVDLRLPTRG